MRLNSRLACVALAAGGLGAGIGLGTGAAQADVFNLTHFVAPGEFAIGIEPELTLTSGAGVGVNARYTQGLTDLLDVSGIIGTGSGPRQFRVGADLDLDLFPDLDKQPGIGIAARGLYVRVPTPGVSLTTGDSSGELELTGIPYLHKAFVSGSSVVDPFFSLPIGMSYWDRVVSPLATAVVGTMIKGSEHLWYTAEFGIAINNTESYFAGGIAYYH